MARVFLLSATPADDHTDFNLAPLLEAQSSADLDRFQVHSVTGDPAEADLIIFLEFYGAGWYFERVRQHPLVRRYREKCFLFCSNPFVIPFLPGVYTGIEKGWASERTRPGFYLGRAKNEFITYEAPSPNLPHLFCFVGAARNGAVRGRLASLRHTRSVFQDTTADFDRVLHRKMEPAERADYHRRYAELIRAAKFNLCPRGLSASSIRVFETMAMGRVPVILSDAWLPPGGPNWTEFSIRVPERDVARIPELLEEREGDAVVMGERARRAWEEWFSEEVIFHRLVDLCLDIRNKRRVPESLGRWTAYLHYLQPFHIRRVLGAGYRALRKVAFGRSAPTT
jgi:glycosyltransferase involved in cell wall biosynthesis